MRELEGRIVIYSFRHREMRALLEQAWPGLPFDYGFGPDFFAAAIGEAEILYAYRTPHDHLAKGRRLRWIQTTGAGADQLMPFDGIPPGVLVTNAAGINADIVADFAVGMVLALEFHLKTFVDQQRERRWKRLPGEPLAGRTLAVIGLGRIGAGVARRGKALGMRVIGTRRSGAPVPGLDAVYPPGDLHRALGQADHVVLTVPLTPATDHLMDARALAAMRPGGRLVNVSRGRVVDEAALLEALRGGRIAGAALDVFENEPLPPEHPLWGLENVIITPHVAGDMVDFTERSVRLFCENLGRYLRGEPLINVVDLARGY